MFLKKGSIPKKLYPGAGGEHIGTIALGKKAKQLYAVMRGFEADYGSDDNHVKNIQVKLSVIHTDGTDTAELHCKFKFNDDNTSGDTFWASCDYLLIGENYTLPIKAAVKKSSRK
ncbi:MAG: hypothetical protein SH856_08065 [Flavobacteriales bacterium]|nr:hypothetical protein [Flavobacteriales bacterium]